MDDLIPGLLKELHSSRKVESEDYQELPGPAITQNSIKEAFAETQQALHAFLGNPKDLKFQGVIQELPNGVVIAVLSVGIRIYREEYYWAQLIQIEVEHQHAPWAVHASFDGALVGSASTEPELSRALQHFGRHKQTRAWLDHMRSSQSAREDARKTAEDLCNLVRGT